MFSEVQAGFLKPGDLLTSENPAQFTTILGSCVSVCLFDRRTHRAGMSHYIFPEDNKMEGTDYYGDNSTVHLIEYMLKNGCRQEDIIASVVGGASSFSASAVINPGQRNISVARRVLNDWHININFEDTGGCHGRKVIYLTDTNEIKITELQDYMGLCKKEGKVCPFRVKKS